MAPTLPRHLLAPCRAAALPATALLLAALGGCTAPQWQAAGMQWQRQACQRIEDRAERQRCEQDAQRTYDAQRAQADTARRAP
jgi:hypothetical protein